MIPFNTLSCLIYFRIATASAMEFSEKGSPPAGLILESPFNNLNDVVTHHPYATPFRWLPWFKKMILESLDRSGLDMSTDYRITKYALAKHMYFGIYVIELFENFCI